MPIKRTGSEAGKEKKTGVEVSIEEVEALADAHEVRAKYKIELIFSRHRSTYKESPCMVLIWEGGKRFHGGGDQKMYWCGYDDCGLPMSSDNFAYMHVVCPHCQKELFLDAPSRATHAANLVSRGINPDEIKRIPEVVGEKLVNLTPEGLAKLLEKTWRQLDGMADIYLKYSPYEIRYDALHETTKDMDNLEKVRVQRTPLSYPLKNIIKDLSAGADLVGRLKMMITS